MLGVVRQHPLECWCFRAALRVCLGAHPIMAREEHGWSGFKCMLLALSPSRPSSGVWGALEIQRTCSPPCLPPPAPLGLQCRGVGGAGLSPPQTQHFMAIPSSTRTSGGSHVSTLVLSCSFIPASSCIFEKRGGRSLKTYFNLMETIPPTQPLCSPSAVDFTTVLLFSFILLFFFGGPHFPLNLEVSGNR